MSISSLFAPNDYVLYAKNLITDGNPAGNVPSMTVVKTTGVFINPSAGSVTAGTLRGLGAASMATPANGGNTDGSFTSSVATGSLQLSVDVTVIASAAGSQVTVKIPQFILTTMSVNTSTTLTLQVGAAAGPVVPIQYLPPVSPNGAGISFPVLMLAAGGGALQAGTVGIAPVTGLITLAFPTGTLFASGCGTNGDIVFTYTF